MPAGRPTEYNTKIADLFCSRIALGDSLRKVVKDDDMPSHTTIYNWFGVYPEFIEQYARAKQDSADSRADQIEEIAEKVLEGEYEPQAARVAIDAFKWTSGKHKPKKYGDRQETIHSGSIGLTDLTDDQLSARLNSIIDQKSKD